MAKFVPADAMKVLADALEEFKSMVDDLFVMDEFEVKLSTSDDPKKNVSITAKLHPENTDEIVLEFE